MLNCFDTKLPVRKDPAVHVSLSSDSLVKQHVPPTWRAVEARASSDNYRMVLHCSSEELQRRAMNAVSGTARRWLVYRLRLRSLSTRNRQLFLSLSHPITL